MVNSNANAMGILFPNSYDNMVPDLVTERLMASIPFAGRYRMVDFVLSSMVNCGIDNISILVRQNYHSLMDHLGSGREWDLTRKNGGLTIFPPYAEKAVKIYHGRIEALASILNFLKAQREKYVILSDTNIAVNFDFEDLLRKHIESGADVTAAYKREKLPDAMLRAEGMAKGFYYTVDMDETGRVTNILINPKETDEQNLLMNIYVLDREFLIKTIEKAFMEGFVYFERDILARNLDKIHVHAYEFTGYLARISSLRSYFDENMKLLKDENLDGLFEPNPIYTKIRDDNPTRYINGATAKDVLVADGCVIEGDVENCVLFRGVQIGKGAKVKNCVLMQDTIIEEGAELDHVITDKSVVITAGTKMVGAGTYPSFVAKHKRV